jgi:uncharacterized protein (TIGR02145 family)
MKMKKEVLVVVMLMNLINYGSSQTVTIGSQVWMTKNLDVDTFRNGDPIPQAKTAEEWLGRNNRKQPSWCYYDYDPANGAKYGKLYNWFAVNDSRGLAPEGYHIPSDAEWTQLDDFLASEAGKKMKSTSGWESYTSGGSKTCPNCKDWNAEYRKKVPCHTCKDERSVPDPIVTHSGNGTNSSGFSGLPGGLHSGWIFKYIGYNGYWWSSSEITYYLKSTGFAWLRALGSNSGNLVRFDEFSRAGLSVRCLKDSDLVKHHFLKYLDEKSINYLLINSLPSLDDCKMVFKDTNADKYFEKIKEINEHWKENIELSESNEIYVDCQIESFTTSDLYLGDDLGGMERIKNKLQPNVTFYSVRYLREKDSQTGMVYKYFVNIKGDWIYFPKPYRILK